MARRALRARRGPASVVLRQERTATDRRSLWASLGAEGELIIQGQDLGQAVESLSGFREYEWSVTVAAADLPKLRAALAGSPILWGGLLRRPGLLGALQRRFSGEKAGELEAFLKQEGVPYTFWNRIGD